jgi:hypothetical protein
MRHVRKVQRFGRHKDVRVLIRYDDARADLAGDVSRRLAGEGGDGVARARPGAQPRRQEAADAAASARAGTGGQCSRGGQLTIRPVFVSTPPQIP